MWHPHLLAFKQFYDGQGPSYLTVQLDFPLSYKLVAFYKLPGVLCVCLIWGLERQEVWGIALWEYVLMISQMAMIIFSELKLKAYGQTTGQNIWNRVYLERSRIIGHQNYKLALPARTLQALHFQGLCWRAKFQVYKEVHYKAFNFPFCTQGDK